MQYKAIKTFDRWRYRLNVKERWADKNRADLMEKHLDNLKER
jgi:hypothetical protein